MQTGLQLLIYEKNRLSSSFCSCTSWLFVVFYYSIRSTLINPQQPPILGSAYIAKQKLTTPKFVGLVPASTRQQYSGLRVFANPQKNHRCELSFLPFSCLKQRSTLSLGMSIFQGLQSYWGVYFMSTVREVLQGQALGTQLRMFLAWLLMCLRQSIFYFTKQYLQTIGFCSESFCSSNIQPKKSTVLMKPFPSQQVFIIPSWIRIRSTSSSLTPRFFSSLKFYHTPSRVRFIKFLSQLYIVTQIRILILE